MNHISALMASTTNIIHTDLLEYIPKVFGWIGERVIEVQCTPYFPLRPHSIAHRLMMML